MTQDQVLAFCLEMGSGAFEWSEPEIKECAKAYLRRHGLPVFAWKILVDEMQKTMEVM